VPFLVLPSATPISLPWLVAGIVPTIAGFVVVPIVMLVVVIMSFVPVLTAAWGKIIHAMSTGKGKKPAVLPFLVLAMPLVVPVVPVALAGCYVLSVLNVFSAITVTHSRRSVGA
jgi:hypothetical protein